ncbi:unnamed protein product [Protopolystoma xenopodis]|uniref:Uncharacterized protein n=1 Tax=Protopolystoma xenopodis TaxID=117903 RepID=A0A448XEE4_9PLAT|nr:unnamed protein product [Protopolystoma xenopodis]
MGVRMEVVERDLFEQACQSPSENRSYCILLSESSISISNSVSLPPAVMQQTPPSGQNSISLQPDVLDFNCAERKGKYTENCEMMELSVCKEAFIEPRISPAVKTVSVRTEQSKMNCNDSLHTSIAINSSINLNKCHFSEGEGLSFPSNIQNYLPRVNEKLGDIPETMDASHSTPTQPFFALQEAYEFKPLSSANSSTTLSIQDQGLEPEYNPQLGRRKARSKEFSIVPSRSIWNSSQIPCRAVRDKSNGSCHNEQPLRRSMRKESRQKSNPARKKPSYSLIDRIFRVTFAGSDFPENRYRNNGLSSSIHLDRLEESRCRAKQRTQNGTNKYCSSTQLFIETSARLQDMRENHVSQASRVKYKDKIRDKPRQRMDLNIGGSKHKTLRRQAPIKYAIESIRKDFEPIHQTTSLMGLNKKQNINQAQNNRTSITGFTESTSLSHTYDARLREYNAKNIRNANVKTVDATEKPECNLRKIEVEANEICENTNNNNISNQLDTNDKNEDGGSNRSKNQIESQPGQKAACSVTSPVMAVDKKELDQAEEMRIATNEFSILSPTTEHFQPKDQPASGSSISGSLSIVVTPDVRNDNSAEARPIGLGQPTARMDSSGQEEHTTDQMLEFSSSRASEPDSDVTLDSADQLPGHLILTPWLRPALRQPLLLPEHLANAYRVNLGTNGQILAHANIYPHTMYAHPHSHPHQQQQTPIISSLSSPVQSGLNQIQHVPSHAHLYPHVVDQRNINIGLISEDGAVPISWTYSVGQVGRLGGLGCGDDGTNRRALLEHQALRLGELGFFSFDQPWDSRGSNSQIGSLSGLYTGYSRSTTLPSVHETSSLENVQSSDDNYESVFEGLLSVFHTRNEHEPDVAFEPTQTAITEITVLRGTSGHLGQVEQIGSMQETDESGMVTVHSIPSEIISSMPLFTPTTPSHSTVTASTSHLRHGLLDSSASACLVTLSQPLPLVPASLPVLGQQHQDSPMVSATPTTSSPSGMSGLPLTVPATSIFRHQGKHGAIHHSPAAP